MNLVIILRTIGQIGIALLPIIVVFVTVYGFALLVKAVYRRYLRTNLDCALQFSSSAVFEGESILVTDILTNTGRLPLPWIHLSYKKSQNLVYPKNLSREPDDELWDDSDYSKEMVYLDDYSRELDRNERYSFVYYVAMRKSISRKSTVLCKKRGYYQITDVTIISNNPLMMGLSKKLHDKTYGVTVYPKLVDYDEAVFPFKRFMGDLTVRRFTDPDPFSFKGIREYQPFDNFKQINFNATAKTGELMSNVYDYTISGEVTIVLNLQHYSDVYNRDYVHEASIRLAAFLCRRYVELGIPVSLVYPLRDGMPKRINSGMSGAHLYTIYTALAHIDLSSNIASASEFIAPEENSACILISSYHEQDLYDKFLSVERISPGNRWIVPYYPGDKIEIEDTNSLLKWRVPHAS